MDPSDFPSLPSNDAPKLVDTTLNTSWADVAKETPNSGHADNVDQNNDLSKQAKGKYLNKDAPEFVPNNLPRSYADITSHAGFPALEPSMPTLNDLSDIPLDSTQNTSVIPPPPPNASFAKIAATTPPSPPVDEKKESSSSPSPSSCIDDDQEAFPPIQTSLIGGKNEPLQSNYSGPSFVQVTRQGLDQAPPSAQSHVDSLPTFDEQDMMTASAHRETRIKKQTEDTEHSDSLSYEQPKNQPPPTTIKDHRKYRHKFTLYNTYSTIRSNGYSWFISLFLALLLHIRYSPCTSPYRFPFIYRSLTDLVTLPIYTKALHATLMNLPILTSDHTKIRQGGLRLQDGFRLLGKLRWWQWGLWASHRIQWLVAFMALQDASTSLVSYSTLRALKNESDRT